MLNINIKNYQAFSGRYIIYENKLKGKEYIGPNDSLIYEGQYLNGKRNGKGIEYNDRGLIIYKGEFLKGKRHGKGIEYKDNGILIIEGEYLNGKINGKGKIYIKNKLSFIGKFLEGELLSGIIYNNDDSDELEKQDGSLLSKVIFLKKKIRTSNMKLGFSIFEGEYLNGKRNGKGKEYEDEKLIFEGEYLNGKRNGKGKEYENGKLIFEGKYLNGKRNGKGKEYKDSKLIFEGEYLNGKFWNGIQYDNFDNLIYKLNNGKGIIKKYIYINKKIVTLFEYEYLNGEKNGKGKEYNCFGKLIFDGEYLNNKRNGKGKLYINGELKFEGEYLDNHKIKGKEFINGILEFEGEYLFDKKYNGKGFDKYGNIIYELINGSGRIKEYNDNDKLIFEGEYLNRKRNGKGKEYNVNGIVIYEGEYLNGRRNGKGKEYRHNGELLYKGEYLNGIRWNGRGKEYNYFIFEGEYINGKKYGKEYRGGYGGMMEVEYYNGNNIWECCSIF